MNSVRALILDLVGDPGTSIDDAAARHLSPDFRQKVNGRWLTRAEFLDGIAVLRRTVGGVDVTVFDELRTGDRYAERHLLTITDTAGTCTAREVYVFATLGSDDRFVSIQEASIEVNRPPTE